LQPVALIAVLVLSLIDLFPLALTISLLTLVIFIAVIMWLYLRYRKLPVVCEKRMLQHLVSKFRRRLRAEVEVARTAQRERNRLLQAEKDESEAASSELQREDIKRNFQALHDQNNLLERRAASSAEILEHEIMVLAPRLRQLAPFTFLGYLSHSLASRGIVAALIAFLLVGTQVLSSVSAMGAAFMASLSTITPGSSPMLTTILPAMTRTPQVTLTPTQLPAQSSSSTPAPTLPAVAACIPSDTPRETALVVGVVDGDTIDVRISDQVYRVRYIGIDTPERDQAYFDEAAAFNQALVYNQTVTLVRDQSETDRFDRLLRYVIAGETFVNTKLVEQGFAVASAYPPDTACAGAFEAAQHQAQSAELGLWMPVEVFIPLPTERAGSPANCDPSYPGVCIPPAPPDLDCGDISYRRFQVLQPDPHNFDGDADGIGCESG
jgi:micrococcal nuclease